MHAHACMCVCVREREREREREQIFKNKLYIAVSETFGSLTFVLICSKKMLQMEYPQESLQTWPTGGNQMSSAKYNVS